MSKIIGWLLVALGVAIPFVPSVPVALAAPLLLIGFTLVMSGRSVIVRIGKGLIAMLVVLGSIAFLKEQIPATQTTSENVRPDLDVELGRLLADYSGNEIAADNKYKGKVIRTVGFVRDVGKDVIDDPYVIVSMSMQESIPELQCALAKSAVDYAASLKSGQPVIVQGKVTGLMLNVQAENCTFVDPDTIEDAAEAPKQAGVEPAEAGVEGNEQAAEEEEPSNEQACRARYQSLTPEDYSPDALAEYQEQCPGFDLPEGWQQAAAGGTDAGSATDGIAVCVEDKMAAFRAEMGEDAMVRQDMLDEWEAECGAQ